jgi:DinB superfamily
MAHPLVDQLRFTRSEFWRGLEGLSGEDAVRRIGPANSISWSVGHLAWQEQRYWLIRLQGQDPLFDRLVEEFCFGCPASTPPLEEMKGMWQAVTAAADPFLDSLTTSDFERWLTVGQATFQPGSLLHRTIYHYWFHLGENLGLRQAMGHRDLAQFVGDIDGEAPFRAWGPSGT